MTDSVNEDEEGKVAVRVGAGAPPAAAGWRPTRPERVSCIYRPRMCAGALRADQ